MTGKSHRFCPLFAHRQRLSLRQGHRKTGFFPQRRRSEIRPPAPTGKSGRQPAHSGPAGPLCPAEKCRQSPDLPQLDAAQISQRRPHPRFQKSRTHFGKSGRVERRTHPRRVRRVGRRPGRDPCPRPPRLCGTAGRPHEKLGQKNNAPKSLRPSRGLFLFFRRRGRGRSAPHALYSCSQRLELWSQRNRAGSTGPAVRSSILKPRKSPARFSNFPGFTKQSSSPFSFSSQLHKSKNHAPQPPHGERLAVIASPLPRSSRKERQLPLRWKEGPWNLCRKFLASFPIFRNHAFSQPI